MSELLQQIDQRRAELGMSKRALANQAGVAISTVFRLLNEPDKNCGWATLTRLADAVGLAVDFDEVEA